jgi:hypothetical protein
MRSISGSATRAGGADRGEGAQRVLDLDFADRATLKERDELRHGGRGARSQAPEVCEGGVAVGTAALEERQEEAEETRVLRVDLEDRFDRSTGRRPFVIRGALEQGAQRGEGRSRLRPDPAERVGRVARDLRLRVVEEANERRDRARRRGREAREELRGSRAHPGVLVLERAQEERPGTRVGAGSQSVEGLEADPRLRIDEEPRDGIDARKDRLGPAKELERCEPHHCPWVLEERRELCGRLLGAPTGASNAVKTGGRRPERVPERAGLHDSPVRHGIEDLPQRSLAFPQDLAQRVLDERPRHPGRSPAALTDPRRPFESAPAQRPHQRRCRLARVRPDRCERVERGDEALEALALDEADELRHRRARFGTERARELARPEAPSILALAPLLEAFDEI